MLAWFIIDIGMRWKREYRDKKGAREWNLNINCFLLDKFGIAYDALSSKNHFKFKCLFKRFAKFLTPNTESLAKQPKALFLCSLNAYLSTFVAWTTIASRASYMQNERNLSCQRRMRQVSVNGEKNFEIEMNRCKILDHPAKYDEELDSWCDRNEHRISVPLLLL